MPVATCYSRNQKIINSLDKIVDQWAGLIGVETKDICLTVIPEFHQAGQSYNVLVNLYLPTMWSAGDVTKIQMALLNVLTDNLALSDKEIFIITSMIPSGQVVENGNIVAW